MGGISQPIDATTQRQPHATAQTNVDGGDPIPTPDTTPDPPPPPEHLNPYP